MIFSEGSSPVTAAASAVWRVSKPVDDNILHSGEKFNAETEKFLVFSVIFFPLERLLFALPESPKVQNR